MSAQRTFTLLSTSDTDLLSARASGADCRLGNPARLAADRLAALADGTDLVVVRILGVPRGSTRSCSQPLLAGPAAGRRPRRGAGCPTPS